MASYRAEVRADSPSLYWAIGYEAGGTHCWDESGNARHGEYKNSPTFNVAGPLTSYPAGKAVTFTAASGTRVDSSYAALTAGNSYTIEAWAFAVQNATNNRLLGTNGANACTLLVANGASNRTITFDVNGSEAGGCEWTSAFPTNEAWHHLAVTFNNATNTCELFVNGTSKGTKETTNDFGASVGNFIVGGPSVAWNGRIAHVAVYPSVLSSARIKAHYDAGVAAPATPAKSTYWGALMEGTVYAAEQGDSPYTAKTTEEFEAHAGRKPGIIHSSDPWLTWNGYGEAAEKTHTYGAIMLKSVGSSGFEGGEDLIEEVIAGTHDSAITTWAQKAKAWGRPFFFRLWWEMNGTWYQWGRGKVTAAQYKEAWKHAHGIISPIAKNATFVWCPNILYGAETTFSSWYPGDAYVDWVGLDGYNSGTWTGSNKLFAESMTELASVAPSKPIMICETSSIETGGNKPNWYADLLGNTLQQAYPKVKAYVHYNNDVEKPYDIESTEAAQNAFKAGIESQYFVNPTVSEFNLRTKVVPYGDPLPATPAEGSGRPLSQRNRILT